MTNPEAYSKERFGKNVVAMLSAALAVLLSCRAADELAPGFSAPSTTLSVSVLYLEGDATTTRQGATTPVEIGEALSAGDVVATSPGAFCVLSIDAEGASLSTVRLAESTTVVVRSLLETQAAGRVIDIGLDAGTILCRVRALAAADLYAVSTGMSVLGVRGTEFSVAADEEATTVAVAEGTVAVLPPELEASRLAAGFGSTEAVWTDTVGVLLSGASSVEAGQELSIDPVTLGEAGTDTRALILMANRAARGVSVDAAAIQRGVAVVVDRLRSMAPETAPMPEASRARLEDLRERGSDSVDSIPSGNGTENASAAGAVSSASPPAGRVLVGLSLPTQRTPRWVADRQRMEAEARRLGMDLRVAVAENGTEEQLRQVEDLIAQNVDVLILVPIDGGAFVAPVASAEARGIPVIAYDRMILDSPYVDLYISFDNVGVGRLQGLWITRTVPRGRYIILSGSPTDDNAAQFKRGAMESIQPLIDSGAIVVVADRAVDDWLPENAEAVVAEVLAANPSGVDAILAPNDGTAGGAIRALADRGSAGRVAVTGQDAEADAARRILDGTQGMTVLKDTRLLGAAAIEAALAFASGRRPTVNATVDNGARAVPANLLMTRVVDRDNVDVLIDSGYLTREAVYGD